MLLLEAIIVIAFVVVAFLKAKQEAGKSHASFSYATQARLLTTNEDRFRRVLSEVTGDRYFLACQVRMADVLDARPYSQAAFNKISRKHFDFVLCDPATTRPLMAIELDDSTHRRAEAQARDSVKDAACRAARFPLLRVPVQAQYDAAYLQKRISETIPRACVGQSAEKAGVPLVIPLGVCPLSCAAARPAPAGAPPNSAKPKCLAPARRRRAARPDGACW